MPKDADALVTQFVPITRRVMAHLIRCKVIVRYAIGFDSIDLRAATERRIMVGLDRVKAVEDYLVPDLSTVKGSTSSAGTRRSASPERRDFCDGTKEGMLAARPRAFTSLPPEETQPCDWQLR
jgi:hypothetical protein